MNKKATHLYHRFLDEAGDTTFYGKGNTPIVGTEGVSHCFILGMVTINEPLEVVRQKIMALQQRIAMTLILMKFPVFRKRKQLMAIFYTLKMIFQKSEKWLLS